MFPGYLMLPTGYIMINNLIIADNDIYVHAAQIKLSLSISTNVKRFFYQTGYFYKIDWGITPIPTLLVSISGELRVFLKLLVQFFLEE